MQISDIHFGEKNFSFDLKTIWVETVEYVVSSAYHNSMLNGKSHQF